MRFDSSVHHLSLHRCPRRGEDNHGPGLGSGIELREWPDCAIPVEHVHSAMKLRRGTSIDVLEIDGASNTGVDSVSDLRDNVRFYLRKLD